MPQDAVHTPTEVTDMLRTIMSDMSTKADIEELRQDLQAVRSEVAKKDDMRRAVMEAKHELMDHTTRECGKVRGDLIFLLRKEDEKVDDFVASVERGGVLSREEALRLQCSGPFSKLA
jgi:hypothetical protein